MLSETINKHIFNVHQSDPEDLRGRVQDSRNALGTDGYRRKRTSETDEFGACKEAYRSAQRRRSGFYRLQRIYSPRSSVTYIKSKHDLRAKTVGIVTDFTIHPYWEDSELDYYVIASEVLIIQGMKKGFPESKFLPIGIPISPKFEKKMNKQEARERLGIEDKPTILVMSGSMGYGNIEKEIVQLDKLDLDFQIAVICGNNKKMKEKIDKLKLSKRIYSFGYVDNVDVFMDACDCMITKPGGLTTSEALAKKIPLIINNPIPGQEDRNVEFLLNAGVAVKASKTFPLDEAVYEMLINNERRILCKQAARFLGKPRSTRNFIEFIKNVCE